MAEYGLIKDTTLLDMGEALRNKGIAAETREESLDFVKYKTSNATSVDDPTPTEIKVGDEEIIIKHEGASSVELVLSIGVEAGTSGDYGWISFRTINDWPMTSPSGFSMDSDWLQRTVKVTTGSFKIRFSFDATAPGACAYTINAYSLDANGNRIKTSMSVQNTLTPSAMVAAINDYELPPSVPEEALALTGDCNYRFMNGGFDWLVNDYGHLMSTKNISSMASMFEKSKVTRIPFILNVSNIYSLQSVFNSATKLEECPKVRGTLSSSSFVNLHGLSSCNSIRSWEELFEPEFVSTVSVKAITNTYSYPSAPRFDSNFSLRSVPSWFKHFRYHPDSKYLPTTSTSIYYNLFYNCYNLDEVPDLYAVRADAATAVSTSNMFSYTVDYCGHLKRFTFETTDGQPVAVKWKGQTLDFSKYVGYLSSNYSFINYNSGITADKEVTDDASYQALKNDPDWFTTNIAYSRYNHDSAVETINSLPDTSAYLATAGGTNTIKFKGAAGSATDGGAINTLTEAEIAVATAKGWTVTLS